MIYLFMLFQFIVLFQGGFLIFDGEFLLGLKVIVGPSLCLYGGAGLRGSLLVGNAKDGITGIILCLIFLAIAYFFYMDDGLGVNFYDYHINGYVWCLIGFAIGYFSAKKEHAL